MSTEIKGEQLYKNFMNLVVAFFPIIIVIILVALDIISGISGIMIIVIFILLFYIYNLSINFTFGINNNNSDECSICGTQKCQKHAYLHQLHTRLHSGNGYGSGYRQGLGNTEKCPNGTPVWEHYLKKYGLLYNDLGTPQSVPDDGIKFVVVEYNTPTDNKGVSLSEIQVWEKTKSPPQEGSSDAQNMGVVNIANKGTVDIVSAFITENDNNSDLSGNKPDTCPNLDINLNTGTRDVYYNNTYRNNQNNNHYYNHYGHTGHRREPIDESHYNEHHDPRNHRHNNHNARPEYRYYNDQNRSLYNSHMEDHYLEGMTNDIKTTLTNNIFSDQYQNIVTDGSNNTLVQKETVKLGLYTAKDHDELYAVRLITDTTLMNATVSLLNGNQQVLYSKKINTDANVYTFKMGVIVNERVIDKDIDDYNSSYKQKIYDVCDIPKNRKQYAIQHRANNPRNNMDCTQETFISTINFKPFMPKANPISNDLI
uniref:Uncharacterized protein n=1 Tax=viral metagenome TaxID=1070528 RepID=A0A6C0BRC7_9ZZZZ